MKTIIVVIAVALMVAASSVAMAAGNLLTNGSFEDGNYQGDYNFQTIYSTDAQPITGWTVTSGSVDWINYYWQAADGHRSLDMNGLGPATIQQTFAVSPNSTYEVSFALAGNPDGGPTVKALLGIAGGSTQEFDFDVTGASKGQMNWTQESFLFQSSASNLATLTFQSITPNSPYGPALDNVAVTAVPEPGSILAACTVLGPVGFVFRRRRA
jgi:choice-of-anchor C domain-containing protein